MYPYDHEDDINSKRRKDPFDFFGMDENFENFFKQFERMWEEALKSTSTDEIQPGSSFIRGFSINVGPDGKPRFQEFGNHPKKIKQGKPIISEEREPLTDIIEGDREISITVEIPGVEKKDIDLNVTEKNLEIFVNNSERRYKKIVDLPCDVIPRTSEATYKNGILDILLKRKEGKKDDQGFNVHID